MTNLHTYIEHTLLKATATTDDIVSLCNEAKQYDFYGVCVNSCYAYLAANELKDCSTKVITTVGFPLGASSTISKIEEVNKAVNDGADEIDMVINIGFLKSEITKSVSQEIRAVKKIIGRRKLKVLIETCHLTQAEIKSTCQLVRLAGADFVKTSTGFGTRGATIKDIITINKKVGNQLQIKASGAIKTAKKALKMINTGADRVGTSNGVAFVYDPKNHEK
jgi:deoxyribose-phosphate aldolase